MYAWMDAWIKRWTNGWIDGGRTDRQKTEIRLCRYMCSLFRLNRPFTAHFDLIGISAAYFYLIDVPDVMTADKTMNVSLKTA